jgi:U3 small nucleolar RNA-associated protein 10
MQYRVSTIETISQILSCFSELGLERLDRSILVSFVESCLCLATQSSMQTFKGSNVMVALSYDCLKQISKALSFDSLCFVVQDLLGNENYIIKEKAVAFLSDRLALDQKVDGINVMEICGKALSMVKISPMTETGFIQSVWIMSNIAFKKFAIDFADQILPLIPIIMGPGGMLHAEDSVVSASLKCMASLCSELGPRILPHINVFMKILLELFTLIVEKEKKGSDLHSSSLELVKAVFEAVPLFLTPFLKECIKFLLFSQTSDNTEIIKTASDILELSSIAIEPRILMPISVEAE